MLQELKWISLQQRPQEQRLVNLYKCVNNINALQIPPYVVRPTSTTRGQNSNSFIPINCNIVESGVKHHKPSIMTFMD
jgi:hypothetical protein